MRKITAHELQRIARVITRAVFAELRMDRSEHVIQRHAGVKLFKILFHSGRVIALEPEQHFDASGHFHTRFFDDCHVRVELRFFHPNMRAPIADRVVAGKDNAAQPALFRDFGVLLRVAGGVLAERGVHVRVEEDRFQSFGFQRSFENAGRCSPLPAGDS